MTVSTPTLTPAQRRDLLHRFEYFVKNNRVPLLMATLAIAQQRYLEVDAGRNTEHQAVVQGFDDLIGVCLIVLPQPV